MPRTLIGLSILIFMILSMSLVMASPFDDAVAVWHLSDLNDTAGANSVLKTNGAVALGEKMASGEDETSLSQGGDGHAARLTGGCLNAGQGSANELNLSGQAMTMFISLQDPEGRWNCGIFSKHGGLDKLVYNLFAVDFGSGMELGFELGIAGRSGCYQVRTPLGPLGLKAWHDVIVTYDGAWLRLYVDGVKRRELAATGSLRTNTEPCLVGSDVLGGSTFRGLIDHAALWNRALTPSEIKTLSVRTNPGDQTSHQQEVAKANASVDAVKDLVVADPYRPIYHLTTAGRFVNDPNGPVYYKGQYHMFFQHLPYYQTSTVATAPGWGHAASSDLVYWQHWPIALMPVPGTVDEGACASGSCVINDDGVPTIVYTSVPPQAQSLATSTDGMKTWVKFGGNPVISGPPSVPNLEDGFRDPFVWKEGAWWYMVVGSGVKGVGGTVLLYRSPDHISWEFLKPLCTGLGSDCFQWECPNFFSVGTTHALIVSPLFRSLSALRGDVKYATGTYSNHTFTPGPWRSLDFGGQSNFYAPNSMLDPQGRRILWGWICVGGSEGYPWNGVLTLPRVITQRPDNRLGMEPAPELAQLRKRHWRFENITLNPGSPHVLEGVSGNCLEILAVMKPGSATSVGLDVLGSANFNEKTRMFYSPSLKRLQMGDKSGEFELLPGEDSLRLHAFVDKSVIELYANKRECITIQARPGLQSQNLRLFCEGGPATVQSIDVWTMDTIWQSPKSATTAMVGKFE